MVWHVALMAAGAVASLICKIDDEIKLENIAEAIKSTAKSEINSRTGDDILIIDLKHNVFEKKNVLDAFKRAEDRQITEMFNSNDRAKELSRMLPNINKKYKKAKAAVNNFKPDKVAVSVGSGENSASVSVENSGAKAVLDQKLADISAEKSLVTKELNGIKSDISNEVYKMRTPEHIQAIEDLKSAKAEYNTAVDRMNASVDKLLNNREWTHKEFVKQYQMNHTQGELIAKGVIYSIVPIGILVYIWNRVFDGLKILKEVTV